MYVVYVYVAGIYACTLGVRDASQTPGRKINFQLAPTRFHALLSIFVYSISRASVLIHFALLHAAFYFCPCSLPHFRSPHDGKFKRWVPPPRVFPHLPLFIVQTLNNQHILLLVSFNASCTRAHWSFLVRQTLFTGFFYIFYIRRRNCIVEIYNRDNFSIFFFVLVFF